MNLTGYTESGQVHTLYNEIWSGEENFSVDDLTNEIKGRLEKWAGVCKDVIDSDQLDLHEYNALYELYKEVAIWYFMDSPQMIDEVDVHIPRETAEYFVDYYVPECIRNVYFFNLDLVIKGVDRFDIVKLGEKTSFAPEIFLEAIQDARVDMVRWGVAEKLADYGYMN